MINDSVTLKWQGVEYECPISMKLCKSMEKSGINLYGLKLLMAQGGVPPMFLVAEFLAWILVAGGCNVTEEEIFSSLHPDPANKENIALYALVRSIIETIMFPEVEGSERPEKMSEEAKKKPR